MNADKKSRTPVEYISLAVAAQMIGITPATLRVYIAEGRIPGYRVGPKFTRVRLADVETLIRPIPTTVHRDRAS